ncbi:hypothetical protein D7V97_39575 [Corallococcus sp. CA053C]|uniref:hypothetical protein n=1 Tax=Corallococcus sp. CA053C TaxID=2316732 RepID=UPI000EA21812|nr:hypothetical protein [Corallococcus sp. CA053C]RKG93962.1 hypothetical protein D7V97_39575 [Corallococcus sp. CA053C]
MIRGTFAAGALALVVSNLAWAGNQSATLRIAPGSNVCLLQDELAVNAVFAAGTVQPRPDGSRPPVRFRLRRSLIGQPGTFSNAAEEVTTDFSFAADAVTRSDLVPGTFRLCALNPQAVAVSAKLDLRTS